MQDDQKKYGYNSLTHGNGQAYYDVQSAYGTSCQPKFYVGQCPSNKFVRPFVPDADDTVSGGSCLQPGMPISEGYSSFKKPVHFFFEKTCMHCMNAHKNLVKAFGDRFHSMFVMRDVADPNNLQDMSNLGGFATPFFFNEETGCSATGDMSTPDLMKALLCHNKPTRMPTMESYQSNDPASVVKELQIEVFTMNGCGWCDKMKKEIRQSGLENYIKISDASEARKQNISVRGFPHSMSHKTGKQAPGYMKIPDLVKKLQ
jgi:glutaredoxin